MPWTPIPRTPVIEISPEDWVHYKEDMDTSRPVAFGMMGDGYDKELINDDGGVRTDPETKEMSGPPDAEGWAVTFFRNAAIVWRETPWFAWTGVGGFAP